MPYQRGRRAHHGQRRAERERQPSAWAPAGAVTASAIDTTTVAIGGAAALLVLLLVGLARMRSVGPGGLQPGKVER